jgi:hypothetical protein
VAQRLDVLPHDLYHLLDVVTTGSTTFAREPVTQSLRCARDDRGLCERCVAGDDRRTKRLRQSNVSRGSAGEAPVASAIWGT